jgi:hypothetical protein
MSDYNRDHADRSKTAQDGYHKCREIGMSHEKARQTSEKAAADTHRNLDRQYSDRPARR